MHYNNEHVTMVETMFEFNIVYDIFVASHTYATPCARKQDK